MYAVIICGGKQYRVSEGDKIKMNLPASDVGTTLEFDKVLMIGDGESIQIGKPFLNGGKVSATVVSQGRHKKIHIIKFRRRKHHEKWQGHRQNFVEVEINKINA